MVWHKSKKEFGLATYEFEDLTRMVLDNSDSSEHVAFGNRSNFGYDGSVYLASSAEGDYILATEIHTPDVYDVDDKHFASLEVVSSDERVVRVVTEKIMTCAKEVIAKRPALEARV